MSSTFFFFHLSGRQLSMMHAIITVSEANKAYAYANLFSREKYTLSIILAAGVLKSRKLTPWTFSPMVSGAGCQNFYQLRRSPKKTPLRSIRFCDTTTIFRSSQNVWQIPKICIVSALISMGNFGELSACLLARASGFMITNSFNI